LLLDADEFLLDVVYYCKELSHPILESRSSRFELLVVAVNRILGLSYFFKPSFISLRHFLHRQLPFFEQSLVAFEYLEEMGWREMDNLLFIFCVLLAGLLSI
jgi:hypothetical protein